MEPYGALILFASVVCACRNAVGVGAVPSVDQGRAGRTHSFSDAAAAHLGLAIDATHRFFSGQLLPGQQEQILLLSGHTLLPPRGAMQHCAGW